MAFLNNMLDTKKETTESAETFIENWIQLSLQTGITRTKENDTRQQARLIKLFERDKLYNNAITMSYMTKTNFDEMISLIILEDEKMRTKEQEVKVIFVSVFPPVTIVCILFSVVLMICSI